MDWMYLFYFSLGMLVFFGAKSYAPGGWNEEYTSLQQTRILRGICALGIALHHMAQKTCAPWHPSIYTVHGLDFFIDIGYLFVAVFLFCSGFGLYRSLHARPDYLKHFIRRRILPVVIAFYLSEFMYTGIRLLMGERMDLTKILWYLSGLHMANENAWYVIVIPFFYLVFLAAFRVCRREGFAILWVFVFTLAYTVLGALIDHQNDWWMRGEWWYNSILLFPVGLLFGRFEKPVTSFMKKGYWFWLFFAFAGVILLFFQSQWLNGTVWGYYGEYGDRLKVQHRLMSAAGQWVVCLFFVVFWMLLMMKVRLGNRALAWLGSVTLEFYLMHGLFVELFGYNFLEISKSIVYIRNVPLYILAVLGGSVPATLLFQWILRKLTDPLTRPKTPPTPEEKRGRTDPLTNSSATEENKELTEPLIRPKEALTPEENRERADHLTRSEETLTPEEKWERKLLAARRKEKTGKIFRTIGKLIFPVLFLAVAMIMFFGFRKDNARAIGGLKVIPPEGYSVASSDARQVIWKYTGDDRKPGVLILDTEIRGENAQLFSNAEAVLKECDWLTEAEFYDNPQGIRMVRGYSMDFSGYPERRYYVESDQAVFLLCMIEDSRYYNPEDCEAVMKQAADSIRRN